MCNQKLDTYNIYILYLLFEIFVIQCSFIYLFQVTIIYNVLTYYHIDISFQNLVYIHHLLI